MEWLSDLFQTLDKVLDILDDVKLIHEDTPYWYEELEKIQEKIRKLLAVKNGYKI